MAGNKKWLEELPKYTMAQNKSWSDLPADILQLIYTSMKPDTQDYVLFRAVCRNWRSFPAPAPNFPWLLHCGTCWLVGNISPPSELSFWSLASARTDQIGTRDNRGTVYCGPGRGYLLISSFTGTDIIFYLLNVLTGARILLPPVDVQMMWSSTLACSGLLPSRQLYILASTISNMVEGVWTCMIFNEENVTWTTVMINCRSRFCFTCLFDKKLFATECGGSTVIYHSVTGEKLDEFPPPDGETKVLSKASYVVESAGDIFRVCRYIHPDGSCVATSAEFKIYKLMVSLQEASGLKHSWERTYDLGNNILFLDRMTGFSMQSSVRFPRNSIFFLLRDGTKPSRYSVDTGRVERVPCPFDTCTSFVPFLR